MAKVKVSGTVTETPVPTPVSPTTPTAIVPTLLQKIDQAALEAGQIVSTFIPAAGAAIEGGAEVEPIIAGLISQFIHLFKSKTQAK